MSINTNITKITEFKNETVSMFHIVKDRNVQVRFRSCDMGFKVNASIYHGGTKGSLIRSFSNVSELKKFITNGRVF